jgi:hypothetical protein
MLAVPTHVTLTTRPAPAPERVAFPPRHRPSGPCQADFACPRPQDDDEINAQASSTGRRTPPGRHAAEATVAIDGGGR